MGGERDKKARRRALKFLPAILALFVVTACVLHYVHGLHSLRTTDNASRVLLAPDPVMPAEVALCWKDKKAEHTVAAVVIPFRDRAKHLEIFKMHWRKFMEESLHPSLQFEIYIVEQFDDLLFNRGWNFNVGLAAATGYKKASPDSDNFVPGAKPDCVAIQDIDLLPEPGVDYGACSVPTQLSSEINAFKWRPPYLSSAGGVVTMSPRHWRMINGFSNSYKGWGCEDDDLFNRLRVLELLFGDCEPFCGKKKENTTAAKPSAKKKDHGKHSKAKDSASKAKDHQIAIYRPKKGCGRFKMMQVNHTKRKTNLKPFILNKQRVTKMQRLKISHTRVIMQDGLLGLRFRIVSNSVDRSDAATHNITYHHLRVVRSKEPHDLRGIRLAIPVLTLCNEGEEELRVVAFGDDVPLDLISLRQRIFAELRQAGCSKERADEVASSVNIILVDLALHLGRVMPLDKPQMLLDFYRYLTRPDWYGLIIVDPRSPDDIEKAFDIHKALWDRPMYFSVCAMRVAAMGRDGTPLKTPPPPKTQSRKGKGKVTRRRMQWKYTLHKNKDCGSDSSGSWGKMLTNSVFQASSSSFPSSIKVTYCDNPDNGFQRLVKGSKCHGKWRGNTWNHGGKFYVRPVSNTSSTDRRYCVGTAMSLPYSLLLPRAGCRLSGIAHDFSFASSIGVKFHPQTLTICVGRNKNDDRYLSRVSLLFDCDDDGFEEVGRFAALRAPISEDDQRYCVSRTDILTNRGIDERDTITVPERFAPCSHTPKYLFEFSLPNEDESSKSLGGPGGFLCVRRSDGAVDFIHDCGGSGQKQCPGEEHCSLRLTTLSASTIVSSMPVKSKKGRHSSDVLPFFNLVLDSNECSDGEVQGDLVFLCPDVRAQIDQADAAYRKRRASLDKKKKPKDKDKDKDKDKEKDQGKDKDKDKGKDKGKGKDKDQEDEDDFEDEPVKEKDIESLKNLPRAPEEENSEDADKEADLEKLLEEDQQEANETETEDIPETDGQKDEDKNEEGEKDKDEEKDEAENDEDDEKEKDHEKKKKKHSDNHKDKDKGKDDNKDKKEKHHDKKRDKKDNDKKHHHKKRYSKVITILE